MNRLVIAAVADIFFASKIRAAAEHLGVEIRFIRSTEMLTSKARERAPDMILVDLHSTNLDPIELAKVFQADADLRSIPLLGFFSHVETELQERAKQAGYKYVLPRSAFANRLGSILKGEI
jgi:PleD family two-component response regulator